MNSQFSKKQKIIEIEFHFLAAKVYKYTNQVTIPRLRCASLQSGEGSRKSIWLIRYILWFLQDVRTTELAVEIWHCDALRFLIQC